MATAEHEGMWLGLVEPERADPCILSGRDEPVRVRARALRPFLRVLCSRCWLDARARPWDTVVVLLCCHRAADPQAGNALTSCKLAPCAQEQQGRLANVKIESGL